MMSNDEKEIVNNVHKITRLKEMKIKEYKQKSKNEDEDRN